MPDFLDQLTCLIWWTEGHAWFNGLTDIPDLMDWQTCWFYGLTDMLIWWTDGHAWFDGLRDKPNLMDWQNGLIWWTDMPDQMDWRTCWFYGLTEMSYIMDWQTCLIWWTDGHIWYEGLTDIPSLLSSFLLLLLFLALCRHCCCGCWL